MNPGDAETSSANEINPGDAKTSSALNFERK
jgi:hypothetical protein